MKEISKEKQLLINMAASLCSCLVSFAVSLMITPIIIADRGISATGYINIANNFSEFAAIAAMALNSMAGRFITIKIHQKDFKSANEYFNSIMYANFAIVAALLLPCILIVSRLEYIITLNDSMSASMISDVKLLFAFTFFNFMVTIISTTFSTATFAKNRVDLQSIRTIEANLLKAAVLFVLFYFLPVKIYFVAIATLIMTLYLFVTYLHYTKKLLPEIQIGWKFFRLQKVLDILSAGIWNTIMRSGQVLTNSLDTMIANKALGSDEGGYVATAKTIATAVNMLYETIAAVFSPALTITYASGSKEDLLKELRSAMKLTGFFANIPLCFVIAFGLPFYTIWLSNAKNITNTGTIQIIYILTVLTMFGTIVGGTISPLFNVFTVVNKVKWNSIAVLIMGVLSTAIVLSFVTISPEYGIYAIVGVSSFLGIIKNVTFTPMYAAHCLGIKKTAFHPAILRYVLVSIAMALLFIGFQKMIPTTNWFVLFLDILLCGVTGSLLNYFFLFEKRERELFTSIVGNMIKRIK